jgi:hypothetical protein
VTLDLSFENASDASYSAMSPNAPFPWGILRSSIPIHRDAECFLEIHVTDIEY